ncbi:MAG: OmpA family protein [Muribaculaceae bacterium]|nr:OmpA family protein [Bacteroidales bacterium]MDE6242725.1 OmpA family protein [Muribaculaceae bacterium]
MKKLLLTAALVGGVAATMSAQQLAVTKPGFFDNMSIGLNGGVTTPLNHGAFFGDMRGLVGLQIQKQITPAFGVGVEGNWGINTSSWYGYGPKSSTAFDSQYVGVYGAVNLFNLFAPYQAGQRVFDIEAVGGAGWGHYFKNEPTADHNYFGTKVGLNFNFHPSERVTIALKPSVSWDMSDAGVEYSSAAYNANKGQFNLQAGVSVALGNGFNYVRPYDQAEVDALNAQINAMRGDLVLAGNALAQAAADNQALANELQACKDRKPEVVTKSTKTDQLSTVRYVNFDLGRYNITASQMPNVAAVASYLKNHPKATVVIKGYASQDGPVDVNIRLANQRAESVKTTLINKYGIPASRIQAEGQGIGHMFEEESWNRVAICTLDEPATSTTTTTVTK